MYRVPFWEGSSRRRTWGRWLTEPASEAVASSSQSPLFYIDSSSCSASQLVCPRHMYARSAVFSLFSPVFRVCFRGLHGRAMCMRASLFRVGWTCFWCFVDFFVFYSGLFGLQSRLQLEAPSRSLWWLWGMIAGLLCARSCSSWSSWSRWLLCCITLLSLPFRSSQYNEASYY
jgi:hypothetical protein